MPVNNNLGTYSVGIGDRFGHQARAQLSALIAASKQGIDLTPVWNKSQREHVLVGTEPSSVRLAAAAAVRELGWTKPFLVDADHIRFETVDRFLEACDFFTVDVAESIGQAAPEDAAAQFMRRHPELNGQLDIAGLERPLHASHDEVALAVRKYLMAMREAGRIYRRIRQYKPSDPFVIEVSMDETAQPQSPLELLVILAGLADEQVPLQTLAPRFSGHFLKGVDYVGDPDRFELEFDMDLCVLAHAANCYPLPQGIKLSLHSGSDKFSIYSAIQRALVRRKAGFHLKTAGTTWLEECLGLAEFSRDGLDLMKHIYAEAMRRRTELCAPYATVIDIDVSQLPSVEKVNHWTAEQFVSALRHDKINPGYNPHLRQLLHVSFRIAAEMGDRFHKLLDVSAECVAHRVTSNLLDRHLLPAFPKS